VACSAFAVAAQHYIAVRDTDVRIRADTLSRSCRAFQRADESRPDGLGLGPFIVKHAADLLGHRVEVRPTEERGSRFTSQRIATR
jgi:signal transduction histidine kinase